MSTLDPHRLYNSFILALVETGSGLGGIGIMEENRKSAPASTSTTKKESGDDQDKISLFKPFFTVDANGEEVTGYFPYK